jgi:hypothetical protein
MTKRETAAERKAREAAENIATFEKNKAEYPKRLMRVMADYANLPGFSFHADFTEKDTYVFSPSEHVSYSDSSFILPAEMVVSSHFYNLESVERYVTKYAEALAEIKRKHAVRQGALAKLNKEERELLNLKH